MNRRNRSQEKNKRSRSQKAEKQKSWKNSLLPTNQRTHLRNESEFSSKRFLGEYSDKGVSGQYLRPNIHPIYHDFVKLLPELAAFLPDLVRSSALDPEQEKRRLYQALLDWFTRLSAAQPLLLIIEDLHWSDETSLEFLLYLVRHVSPHPILLLLTYRSEEVHP